MMAQSLNLLRRAIVSAARTSIGTYPRHLSAYRPFGNKSALETRFAKKADITPDFEEEEDDLLSDFTVPVRRRLLALKDLQQKQDELSEELQKEKLALEAKYQSKFNPLYDERKAIVEKSKEVGKFDLPDSSDPDEGIPDFWLTAIMNHDIVSNDVTERDAEVLKYLKDIRVEVLTGDPQGFKLEFVFDENPFFKNKVLEKTYTMLNLEEMIPDKFTGCTINWYPGKDTTTVEVVKKVQDKKSKGKAPPTTIKKVERCDSFFHFFNPVTVPENPEDMTDEELDTLQGKMDTDYELGDAFRSQIVPRAVDWYTGEAAVGMDYGDYGEYDEFEEEEYYEEPPPRKGKGGRF